MTKPRRTIAVLADTLAGEYQTDVRSAIERAAAERDTNLLFVTGQQIATLGSDSLANTIYELVTPRSCDGIIALSGTFGHRAGVDGTLRFLKAYAPLPACSIGIALPGIASVIVDNAGGMALAVEHLIVDHRRRRFAYIAGPASNDEARLRLEAARQKLELHGLHLDPALLVHGDFTTGGGAEAMRQLLAKGVPFDAVVGANDNMALGAMQVLQQQGISVPGEVVVTGFDDVTVARFGSPSLTTVRQPLRRLAAAAVESVLDAIDGKPTFASTIVPVEFVRRESCGCGYQLVNTWIPPRPAEVGSLPPPAERQAELAAKLRETVTLSSDTAGDWPERLLGALNRELRGEAGVFLSALDDLLEEAAQEGIAIDEFQRAITLLRREGNRARSEDPARRAAQERLWHAARMRIGDASVRTQGKRRLEVELSAVRLAHSGERFATALSLPLLERAIVGALPEMGIPHAAVFLCSDTQRRLRPFVLLRDGEAIPVDGEPFDATELRPADLFGDRRFSLYVMPLTFEARLLGVSMMAAGANETIYETLRHQIGSALTTASMHRQVVEQIAARERVEKESAAKETRMAAAIQTSIVPQSFAVDGLDIAARMLPAADAGGDYYDVVATEEGAWLAVGDVSGHGLAAGLIMLMLQSMMAVLLRRESCRSPAEVVTDVNRALFHNLRDRLGRDDHATLVVLLYRRDGHVVFAGAHEELLVVRHRTGQVECISTTGVWVGAMQDVRAVTHDAHFLLEDGDLLVLFTDGVVEARNAQGAQFGIERLCATLQAHRAAPVEELCDAVLRQVRAWTPTLDDDVTLLALRYQAPRGG